MDEWALNERPDLSTVLNLHKHQRLPELFYCDYRAVRRPPTRVVVRKPCGRFCCSTLGLTVPTGGSGKWRTRKAKLPMDDFLMTDLAASASAQAVQQHAAATDWPCIANVGHQCFIPSERYAQQLTSPHNAHTNSTAGSIHSMKGSQHMGAAATYLSHDSTAYDIKHQKTLTTLQQQGSAASGIRPPACTVNDSDAKVHPHAAMVSNMANERSTMTHVPTTTRKRKCEVLTEQSGVDEEDGRDIQPETPDQGDMPRDRATFRRINHSSRDTPGFATPQVGDIVWAKVHNYQFWPAQVTHPADNNQEMLWEQYGSVTKTGMHVTFFGDNGSVGYAKPGDVKPFIGEDEGSSGSGRIQRAVKEAKDAQRGQVHQADRHKRQRQS